MPVVKVVVWGAEVVDNRLVVNLSYRSLLLFIRWLDA